MQSKYLLTSLFKTLIALLMLTVKSDFFLWLAGPGELGPAPHTHPNTPPPPSSPSSCPTSPSHSTGSFWLPFCSANTPSSFLLLDLCTCCCLCSERVFFGSSHDWLLLSADSQVKCHLLRVAPLSIHSSVGTSRTPVTALSQTQYSYIAVVTI